MKAKRQLLLNSLIIYLTVFFISMLSSCDKKQAICNNIPIEVYYSKYENIEVDTSTLVTATKPILKINNFNEYYSEYLNQIGLKKKLDKKFYVAFIVDTTGEVIEPYVALETGFDSCKNCKELAIKIINSTSGKWIPSYVVLDDTVYLDSAINLKTALVIDFAKNED